MRAGALTASGILAAFAGVPLGNADSADPSSTLAFLMPVFAAAFLGSTAIFPGRFNAPQRHLNCANPIYWIYGAQFSGRRQFGTISVLWWRLGKFSINQPIRPGSQTDGVTAQRI